MFSASQRAGVEATTQWQGPCKADRLADADAVPIDTTSSNALLLIHTDSRDGTSGGSVESVLLRMRTLFIPHLRHSKTSLINIQIDDLKGVRVFTIDNPGPLICVPPIAPGTYHVTARQGDLQRRYTMALHLGAPAHLHLNLHSTSDRAR